MTSTMHLKERALWSVLVVLLIALLPGCAGKKSAKKAPFFEKWRVMAEESKAYLPPAKARSIPLPEEEGRLEEETTAEPEKPLPTQKVNLKMHNADVAVLLRTLARAADLNIMIKEGTKGRININVKDAPWDQVFRGILRTQGLTYTWEGDIIRVVTLEEMEHDLKMDAIQEKRKIQELGLKRVEPLLTWVIHINYADASKLKENLQVFLTKDREGNPRGSVIVDEHTNALVIQAIRDDITRMIPLIENLDSPIPQILIEANIVETSRDTARELGIQWGGLYHGTGGGADYWITPGANSEGILGQSLTAGGISPTSGTAANFPADLGTEGAGLTIGYVAEWIGEGILNVQLSALQEEGKLNILSSPSITTLDNQAALIESGREVPFQTINEEGDIEIEWKKAVLRLEVTPHVIDGKMLKMKIVTNKDELDFTRMVLGNPTIITKRAETNIILFDGQTTVIGGLTKESRSGSETGIPWLKDIPLLGYIFGGESKSDKMEEVLIFITPHVLKEKVPARHGEAQQQESKEETEEAAPSSKD